MKVLWATAKRLGEDLASTTQLRVADVLAGRGCEVTFVAPKGGEGGGVSVDDSRDSLIAVQRSRKSGLGWLTFTRSLKKKLPKVLGSESFDVALVEWQAVAGCHRALNQAGIPWLLVDRSPPVFRTIFGRLQWFEYRRAYRLARKGGAAGSVVKSPAMAEWNEVMGRDIHPVTLLEAGVDVSRFTPSDMTGLATIVYHGRLDAVREILRLVRIGEILIARGVDFKLLIAGDGDSLQELKKLTLMHPWLDVREAIPATEIPDFLATAHIGLFPLPDNEVWRLASPLKIREWAAAGLPMVLSDITPHRTFGNRDWATLVKHDAPLDEWVDAIEDLLAQDLSALGGAARGAAESEFDWKMTSEALHQRLVELVGD